jgi:tetraacyldisaccharide 4'-kinase
MSQSFFARRLLFPLIPLYQMALALRQLPHLIWQEPVQRLRFPVISIGNLSTGGSGKTPLTIALAQALQQRGFRVDVLSRGYGRQGQLTVRVNPNGTAEEFGDEPLLIAQQTGLPVYVAPRRYDAGLLAETDLMAAQKAAKPETAAQTQAEVHKKAHAQVGPESASPEQEPGITPAESAETTEQNIIPEENLPPQNTSSATSQPKTPPPLPPVHLLDDGFQHSKLVRTVNILLLDRRDWQDWLLPAGNLREPRHAIGRASLIAIPAGDAKFEMALRDWGWQGPIWRLRRKLDLPLVAGPVTAFCGIARPEQFFQGLEARGLRLAARLAFPDHFRYTAAILEHLLAEARAAGARTIITTEKDLARLGQLASIFPKSLPLKTAHLRTEIEDQATAIDWLVDQIAPRPTHPPL